MPAQDPAARQFEHTRAARPREREAGLPDRGDPARPSLLLPERGSGAQARLRLVRLLLRQEALEALGRQDRARRNEESRITVGGRENDESAGIEIEGAIDVSQEDRAESSARPCLTSV